MLRPWCLLTLLVSLANVGSLCGQEFDPAARAAAIAPLIDDQTLAIGHVDLSRIDVPAAMATVANTLPMLQAKPDELKEASEVATKWLEKLRAAGAREVFAVVSLADVPKRPPFFAIVVAPDADTPTLEKLIFSGPSGHEPAPPAGIVAQKIAGKLVIAHEDTIARLRELKPVERPQLVAALRLAGDTAVQGVFIPSDDARRVISELMPPLPKELGELTGADLAAAVQYAVVGLDLPPKIQVLASIESKDAASAEKLQRLVASGLTLLGRDERVKELLPKFGDLAKALAPEVRDNRLTLRLTEENGGVTQVLTLLTPPVQAAREAAQRAQSMNNLKQLALVMHIYHDANGAFPPAQFSKDGKPLLSWRVHALPYIEQKELYDQFKLDEPWDSDHNKQLIEKMPTIFASPAAKLEPGKTVYLLPTGKGLVFDGDRKTKLTDVTDGTSNTLMIVEANPEKAVIWTKPEDLEVDVERPLAGLGGLWKNGFLTAFCDGSVRMIAKTIDPKTLRAIFLMSDGEVVQLP